MFCSFLGHRELSLRLSDGACHFSESPCNPWGTGTTCNVVLSFLFNLMWHIPPWRTTWEKYNLSNLALAAFNTPLASVCVCGCGCGCECGARPRLSFSWLCFRNECWMQTHWGVIKGLVVHWWDVYLAVSALNNRLKADSHFRTCSLDIEYCEILASTTEMFSSAANLGHLQCHFLLLLHGNPVLPWSFQTSCPVSKGPTLPNFNCI